MTFDLRETARFLERVASMGGPLSGNAMEHARRMHIEADLSTRPEALLPKPICYGIFNAKGEMHWSESCISPQREELGAELESLTDSEMPPNSEGWHIAPLYAGVSPQLLPTKDG